MQRSLAANEVHDIKIITVMLYPRMTQKISSLCLSQDGLQEPSHAELISCTVTSKSKGNATDDSRCRTTNYREPTRKTVSHQKNLQITITTDILTPQSISLPALKLHSDTILKSH
jgi:hypothetical protein